MGLDADDASSTAEPELAEWRKAFSTVMGSGRWVESADSAQFDVTIFTRARMTMRREGRPQLVVNVTRCGDVPTTQLQLCTDDAIDHTETWSTNYDPFHIIRRRSDGAMRVWRHHGVKAAAVRSRVAGDLRKMLRAGEER